MAEFPTGFAIHQMKRDKAFRKLVKPPPGCVLVEHDFSGQEYRWMGVESGDETMLSLCLPGEDGHAYLGAMIAEMDYRELQRLYAEDEDTWKPTRQFGKVGNLSCQYRTSPPTLQRVGRTQYATNMTLDQATRVVKTYKGAYRMVPKYWWRQIKKGKAQGYVETLAGRRINVGFGENWPEDKVWGLESTCINFPIQGVGADQKYLGLAIIKDYLNKHGGRFAYELHDGLYTVWPQHLAEKAAHEMKAILSNLPYERAWGVKLPIAFPVDAKMGPSWGELKELH